MVQTIQARPENELQAPARRPVGRLLAFRSAPSQPAVGVVAATPAPYIARDGYGRPITRFFGLQISGAVNLSQPFETRRQGGIVEVFQNRSRA